jgi:hypothetical protein
MKPKKEYLFLAIIIIALALYLMFHQSNRTHYQLPKLPEVVQKRITKIQISKADGTIVLNKKDDAWRIAPENFLADATKVERMLSVIEDLTVSALVSESKNYVRYELNADKKIAIKAWEKDTLAREFDIGKSASTYQHTFIKLAGDPNIYHGRGEFRRTFDQKADDLRDKTVLAFTKNDIREIGLHKGEKQIALKRTEKEKPEPSPGAKSTKSDAPEFVWQMAGGKIADAKQVNQLLDTLSNLKCDSYLEKRSKEDFKNPMLQITLKDEQVSTISLFQKSDDKATTTPATSSQNASAFNLAQFQTEDLNKFVDALVTSLEQKK